MDNLTHSLVGLAAAKAGLGRRSPYATFVCVGAANLPDIDIVALAGGPAFYLQHHRGITHSIVGTLALAVAFPLLFVAGERLWARLRGREGRASLRWLLACSLLLSASHPLLDWTNSYGVRPLLPWDGRWIYGDLLFIVDPWVWLALGGACSLLAAARWQLAAWGLLAVAVTVLFVLAGARPDLGMPAGALVVWGAGLAAFVILHLKKAGARFGRRAPAVALALVVVYCGALAFLQRNARRTAEWLARDIAGADERILHVAATPLLANPFAWRCLAEAERSTFRFDLNPYALNFDNLPEALDYEKPTGAEAEVVGRASGQYAARVLLDFARFPAARVVPGRAAGGWVVQFADLRYTEPGSRARVGGFALDVPVAAAAPAR
ncbi:MAG TPA: metal-dependent hydrolase [Pyrinomonadaceae bacterium]